jgi:hypothetical protein
MTKKGYDVMRERYPDSLRNLNQYCRMACYAGDRELAKKLFQEIGENFVKGEWFSGEFDRAKAWALAH